MSIGEILLEETADGFTFTPTRANAICAVKPVQHSSAAMDDQTEGWTFFGSLTPWGAVAFVFMSPVLAGVAVGYYLRLLEWFAA